MADHRLSQVSTASSNNSRRTKAYIGPWQLGKTLGRGSSGRVRLAKHTETDKLAAVKIVSKSQFKNQQSAHHAHKENESYGIEREVIIMKLIEHPNVMALYDVWENQGELYLVLEYVEGGELFDYLISRGRLNEAEAVHYFRQICYGVDYCHRFNICHRDLKPENLLLDKNRNIKIADFGMAALESSDRLLETSCGSPHYASPEIVTGKTYHGGPSDIWSCGVILFALLTGHLPFDDDNIRKLLLKVQAGRFSMPAALSPEAKDIISKMLVVDPAKRITMREILRHPLLRKYPARNVPRQNMTKGVSIDATQPILKIDKEILRNLQTLWHHDSIETLVKKLRSPDPNVEKTFYMLLLRFRKKHGLQQKERMPRNRSTTSMRTLPSSKSIRSIASVKSHTRSGSIMSAFSNRSVRSGTTVKTPRIATRRSPTKNHKTHSRTNSKSTPAEAILQRAGTSSHNNSDSLDSSHVSDALQSSSGASKLSPNSKASGSKRQKSTNFEPNSANAFAALLDQVFSSSTAENTEKREIRATSNPTQLEPTGKPELDSKRIFSAPNAPLFTSFNFPTPEVSLSKNVDMTGIHSESKLDSFVSLNTKLESLDKSADNSASRTVNKTSPSAKTTHSAVPPHTNNAVGTLNPSGKSDDRDFILPMIFEEDKFADSFDQEFNWKDSSERSSSLNLKLDFDTQDSYRSSRGSYITEATESSPPPVPIHGSTQVVSVSYKPSPAAASVSAPVRKAPVPPKTPNITDPSIQEHRRVPSGPRAPRASNASPINVFVESESNGSTNKNTPNTTNSQLTTKTRPVLSEISAAKSNARTGPPITTPTRNFTDPEKHEQLFIPKNSRQRQPNQTDKSNLLSPPTKENGTETHKEHRDVRTWIRRFTPRLSSKKSNAKDHVTGNSEIANTSTVTARPNGSAVNNINQANADSNTHNNNNNTNIKSKPNVNPSTRNSSISHASVARNSEIDGRNDAEAFRSGITTANTSLDDSNKENLVSQQNGKPKAVVSTQAQTLRPLQNAEPNQNWVMKFFSGISQPASQVFVRSAPLNQTKENLLNLLNSWTRYGLSIRKSDDSNNKFFVSILKNNTLRMKSAVILVLLSARSQGSEIKLTFHKGSRHSFHTFCHEINRNLASV